VRFPDGESPQDLAARTADALRLVLARHGNDTIVLVGHDSVNRALLLQLMDLPLSAYWRIRQREEQEQHGHTKRVAFVLALRSVIRRYFRLRMKVHMDQAEALEHVTPFLFVGNNRYQTAGLERKAVNSRRRSLMHLACTSDTGRSSTALVALTSFCPAARSAGPRLKSREKECDNGDDSPHHWSD
jgi:hypothetical protein